MANFSIKLLIAAVLLAAGFLPALAQSDSSTRTGRGGQRDEEMPKNIRETMARQRIEREKKEFEELLRRSEEAVKLSQELEKSYLAAKQLSAADQKKLERLEKLLKKIRSELGGNDDDDAKEEAGRRERPEDVLGALKSLQSNATQLFDEIKKSTRYSISVISIQTSNALLRLVKFIRFGQ